MKIIGTTAAFGVLLGCVASPVFAQSAPDPVSSAKLRVGPLGLTPAISLQDVGIDTNVFNEPVEPKQDFTATLLPRLEGWLRLGRATLSLEGSLEAVYFREYADQRSLNGGGSATLEYRGNRAGMFVGGGLRSTQQRPNFEIDVRARQVYQSWTAGGDLRVSGKTALGAIVLRQTTDFDGNATVGPNRLNQALNRTETVVTAFVDHRVTPLTTLRVRADYQEDDFAFSPSRNARRLRVTPGVEFKPFALLSGSALVGYQRFEPLNGLSGPSAGAFAAVNLEYTLTERTRLAAGADRDVEYSFDAVRPYYVNTGVSASVTQALSTRWGLTFRATRQRHDYGQIPLSASAAVLGGVDTVTGYGGGLVWRIGADMQVGVNADYQRRRAVDPGRAYEGLRVGSFVAYAPGGR